MILAFMYMEKEPKNKVLHRVLPSYSLSILPPTHYHIFPCNTLPALE